MSDKRFVVRVYAIIVNENREVLLSDEYVLDTYMTKFPGGGLEWGEGTLECVKREAVEEFGQDIEVTEHFYTTDFFQKALFYDEAQLISIYYLAQFTEPIRFKVSQQPFDFAPKVNGSQSFRWEKISNLSEKTFTFPIDKRVGAMLLSL